MDVSIPFSCVGKGSGVRIGRVRDTTGDKCRLAPRRIAPGTVQPCLASAQDYLCTWCSRYPGSRAKVFGYSFNTISGIIATMEDSLPQTTFL